MSSVPLRDGRVVPNHFADATAAAAALGGVAAPSPQFPGAVPAPEPDPTMIPTGPAAAPPAPPPRHRTVKKSKKAKHHK